MAQIKAIFKHDFCGDIRKEVLPKPFFVCGGVGWGWCSGVGSGGGGWGIGVVGVGGWVVLGCQIEFYIVLVDPSVYELLD